MPTQDRLENLINIGPKIADRIRAVGISSADEFLKSDPYDVFEKMDRKERSNLCRCVLACLVGAKYGQKWHEITKLTAKEYEKRRPEHRWRNNC